MSKETKNSEVSVEEQISTEAKKTDFGQMIYDLRKPLMGVLALVLVGVGIYSFMNTQSSEKAEESQMAVYQFQQKELKSFLDKKTKAEEFISQFKTANEKLDEPSRMLVVAQEAFKKMKESKDLESAKKLLSYYWAKVESHNYASQIVGANLMALCEETKDYSQGIKVVESLVKSGSSVLPAYFYLNLARFYQKSDNKKKAKVNYQHLIDKYPETEEAKIAKVLVNQI